MTPIQKIKRENLLRAINNNKELIDVRPGDITACTVDLYYETLKKVNDDARREYEQEFRETGIETGLNHEYSRHYEVKAVAKKLSDGTWIGWDFYFGGGKHGEPESVPWMEYAYDLDVTETEKLMIVREFKKTQSALT